MEISAIKSKIHTFLNLLSEPEKMVLPLARNGLLRWVPDKIFLKIAYRSELHQRLDLLNPISFSEKIQWLKLYDRKPIYVHMVDKYLVKDIVAQKIGKEYVIPTYGLWNNANDINFDQLPNSFVLKCNHDSGGVVICRDKKNLNQHETIIKLNACMQRNAYYSTREWPYKNVKRKIIAEELLVDPDYEDLVDYKFYCFHGEPIYCQVIKNRNKDGTIDFYDMEWNIMPFTGLGLKAKKGTGIQKPINFEKMMEIAKQLSKDTFFVRIDLYNISGKIYFGEFTLYPTSGFGRFIPNEWNTIIGEMINLPL